MCCLALNASAHNDLDKIGGKAGSVRGSCAGQPAALTVSYFIRLSIVFDYT